ncbi:unnamed protein product, partial [Discosporangium mesarthrocarpum]
LKRWAAHEKLCPRVTCLAMKLLCIHATSALSEQLFSQAGLILTQHRASLKSDSISVFVFLQGYWITYKEERL